MSKRNYRPNITPNRYTKFLSRNSSIENDKNNKNDKTVIMVWKQSFFNLSQDNFWGLGDLIRGVIGLFKICKKYNFKMIADLSLHPLSQFLKYEDHQYSNIVRDTHNSIPFVMSNIVESYIINKLYTEGMDYVCICSNMSLSSYESECSEELSEFIKNIFCPNDMFCEYLRKFSRKDYSIIHYRLGDYCDKGNYDYKNAYDHLLRHYKESDIFITDSQKFKDIVRRDNVNIDVLNTKVCHIGYNSCYEDLRDTLVEFFMIINSKGIRSFSTYGWISGFVYVIHYVFKVPLEGYTNLKF